MSPVRQILWKLLVVGMIPFILGAGLPQMECRCAAAKGQRWCECCFRKPAESKPSKTPLKACCQRQLALQSEAKTSASACPTCHQFTNSQTGSCCSLKQNDAPTLSAMVDVPNLDVALMWLPLAPADLQTAIAATTARQGFLSRASLIPPVDRVIVFEHLLI